MQAIRASILLAAALACPLLARAESIFRVDTQATGQAVAVDENGMLAYVADAAGGFVTVVDQTGTATRVPVGPSPRWIAAAGDIYVSNAGDGTVSILPASGGAPLRVAVGGSGPIVATPFGGTALHGKAYLVRQQTRDLAVVDAATLASHPIDAAGRATAAIALDASRHRLYASQPDAGMIRVIDISSDSSAPPAIDVAVPGRPGPITQNGIHVYALTADAGSPLVQLDPSTLQAQAFSLNGHGTGEPRAIAATGNRVFMGFANEFVILDLLTGNVRAYPMNGTVQVVADALSGNGYGLDAAGQLVAYNAFNERITFTALPAPAYDMRFIYKTQRVYVATAQGLVEVSSPAGDIIQAANAQGLWWAPNGAESGWGINIAHQDDILFATWFTYDAQGRATWLVASDARSSSRNNYSGTLYRTSGPAFNATPFDPAKVTRTPVGSFALQVIDFDNALLTATVDGTTVTKPLAKQVFASPEPYCTWTSAPAAIANYTDLWWASPAGSESGWGLNIEHQGDILFITWFTYDGGGQPMWFVGSDLEKTGNATYSGALYTTAGPPLAAQPWDPSRVTRMPAGNATLAFSDDANGTFTYTVGGVTQSKAITRQVFGRSTTRCQ
jgi:hypothetical protein